MMRTILIVALVLVGVHLLFGAVLLIIDTVHRVNDQDFSFVLWLLYYYLNYSAVWMLKCMNIEFSFMSIILMGLPQWILLSLVVGSLIGLYRKKKAALP